MEGDFLKELEEEKRITRRTFFEMMAKLGSAGIAAMVGGALSQHKATASGCGSDYSSVKPRESSWAGQCEGKAVPVAFDNPSIVRDHCGCIHCGSCVEVCHDVQTVYGYYAPPPDGRVCINCGQCTLVCPTGVLHEQYEILNVLEALQDPTKFVVVQTAPAIRVALGEEFGMSPGTWVAGKMVAALRRLGFKAVLDTNFTADLTIMEEATELIRRIKGELKRPLPQFTSCSPGWVKFCEYFYPDLLPYVSSCKSPQQMFGALVKTYWAEKMGIDPRSIFCVSIMPCTAKKFEARRPEMVSAREYWAKKDPTIAASVTRDVDAVLTTRELARMIKQGKIDLAHLPDENFDPLMGKCTGGAIIFGATGGVMEAALRTAYYFITGQEPPAALLNLTAVRGLEKIKEAAVEIPGAGTIRVAVVDGMGAARQVLELVRQGKAPWHFVEFMGCPGGCQGGGGEPPTTVPPSEKVYSARIAGLYAADVGWEWRESHENADILKIYQTFLGHPMSELAEELLHTSYVSRADVVESATAYWQPAGVAAASK